MPRGHMGRKRAKINSLLRGEGTDGEILENRNLLIARLNEQLFEGFQQGRLQVDERARVESFDDG